MHSSRRSHCSHYEFITVSTVKVGYIPRPQLPTIVDVGQLCQKSAKKPNELLHKLNYQLRDDRIDLKARSRNRRGITRFARQNVPDEIDSRSRQHKIGKTVVYAFMCPYITCLAP